MIKLNSRNSLLLQVETMKYRIAAKVKDKTITLLIQCKGPYIKLNKQMSKIIQDQDLQSKNPIIKIALLNTDSMSLSNKHSHFMKEMREK